MARPFLSNTPPAQSQHSGTGFAVLSDDHTNTEELNRLAEQTNADFFQHQVNDFFTAHKTQERQIFQGNYQQPSIETAEAWLRLGCESTAFQMLENMQAVKQSIQELLPHAQRSNKKTLKSQQQQIDSEIQKLCEIIAKWGAYALFHDLNKRKEIATLLKTYKDFSLKNNRSDWANGVKQRALNIMAELQSLRRTLESLLQQAPHSQQLHIQRQEAIHLINLFATMIAKGNTDSLFQDDGSIAHTIGLNGSDYRLDLSIGNLSETNAHMRTNLNPNEFNQLSTTAEVIRDLDRSRVILSTAQDEKKELFFRSSNAVAPVILQFKPDGTYQNRRIFSETTLTSEELHPLLAEALPDIHPGLVCYLSNAGLGQSSVSRFPSVYLLVHLGLLKDNNDTEASNHWVSMSNVLPHADCIVTQLSPAELSIQLAGLENQFEARVRIKNLSAHNAVRYDLTKFETWPKEQKVAYFAEHIEIEFHTFKINLDLENWPAVFSLERPNSTIAPKEITRSFWQDYADYAFSKVAQLSTSAADTKNPSNLLLDENDLGACAKRLYTHYLSSGNTPAQARAKVTETVEPWFKEVARSPEQQTQLALDIQRTKHMLDKAARENARATEYLDSKDNSYLARLDNLHKELSQLDDDKEKIDQIIEEVLGSAKNSLFRAPKLLELIKLIPQGPSREKAIIAAIITEKGNIYLDQLKHFDWLSEAAQSSLLHNLSKLDDKQLDDTQRTALITERTALIKKALGNSKPGFFKNLRLFLFNKSTRWAAWRSLKKWASDAPCIYTAPQLLELIKLIPQGLDREKAIIAAISPNANPVNNQTLRNDPKSCIDLWLYVRLNFQPRSRLYQSVCGESNLFRFDEVLDQPAVKNCVAFNKIRILRILHSPTLEEDCRTNYADQKLAEACKALYTQDSHHSLAFFIGLCSNPVEIERLAKIGFPPVLTELYMGQLFHYPKITALFLRHAPKETLVKVRTIFSAAKTVKYRTSEAFLSALLTDPGHTKQWLEQDLESLKETCSMGIVLQPAVFENVIAVLIESNQVELAKDIAQRQDPQLLKTLLTTRQQRLLYVPPAAAVSPPPSPPVVRSDSGYAGLPTPVTSALPSSEGSSDSDSEHEVFCTATATPPPVRAPFAHVMTSPPSSADTTSPEVTTSEGSGSDSEDEIFAQHETTTARLCVSSHYNRNKTGNGAENIFYSIHAAANTDQKKTGQPTPHAQDSPVLQA